MVWIAIIFVLTVVIWFFLVCPALRRHPDSEYLKGTYIAHRGLHDESDGVPENSATAFLLAANEGYAIENDIHITSDGEVVVFHDDTLERMCGVSGRVEDKTLSELKMQRLAGTGERIPTLSECLSVVDGKVPLLIEFKCDHRSCKKLCKKADEILSHYNGKYFVQSFYPPAMGWYLLHKNKVCRGQLALHSSGSLLKRIAGALLFNFVGRPDFISYDRRSPNTLNRKICNLLGAIPIGWTFRSQEELDSGEKHFVTFIFEKFVPKRKDRS